MLVSVVVPTYNERENIAELVERLSGALRGAGHEFEIVIVDDNSPDGTAEAAERLAQGYPVRVIKRPGKLGLGSAIMDGIRASRGRLIVVMDADLQHPPEVAPELVRRLAEGCDVAVASRYARGGGVEGWPLARRIISMGASIIAHVMLPRTRAVSDPMSGFFAVRREVVDGVELSPKSFKALLDVLQRGRWSRACEVPFVFKPRARGRSKLGVWEMIRYLRHVLELASYRPLKFAAVGASGVLVNIGVLRALLGSGAEPPLAGLAAIEASILSNFFLNDSWTFRDSRRGPLLRRLLSYHASVAAGAAINFAVLLTLMGLSVHYVLAALAGIAAGFATNYLISSIVVWGYSAGERS